MNRRQLLKMLVGSAAALAAAKPRKELHPMLPLRELSLGRGYVRRSGREKEYTLRIVCFEKIGVAVANTNGIVKSTFTT